MSTPLPGPIKLRIIHLIVVLFFQTELPFLTFSQEIRINGSDMPLNHILIQLRDENGIMFSFDDRLLSTYKLTLDKKFSSPEPAIDYLFRGLPLRYEKINGVYTIYPVTLTEKPKYYVVAGSIADRTSHETLPFSGLLINNKGFFSDAKGNFSFTSATDSIFAIRISYLGYYILDTTVTSGTHHNFRLTPSVIDMKEVIILGPAVERSIQTGNAPGIIKLNHKIANFLPGYGDNSVFNLLRLQPGILAAGDQATDLIIWGSYEGQSQVIFDGFTLYGMKNFNDNISAINPFMAKDIKVLKGGYGAEYGEKAGAIVDITGMDGNRLSTSAWLCINNMTLNGLLSIPFRKRSSLVMAYRQTYYNLYDPEELNFTGSGRGRQNGGRADYYLAPDYVFRDMNLKYSGTGSKSNYYVSLYHGRDLFEYSFDQESMRNEVTLDYREKNRQYGGSGFYGFRWKGKNTSNIILSYSSLQTDRNYQEEVRRSAGNQIYSNIDRQVINRVEESHVRIENKLGISEKHVAEAGFGLLHYMTYNRTGIDKDSSSTTGLLLPYFYLQDNMDLLKRLTVRPGIRAGFHCISGRIYLQPRVSAIYRINDSFRLTAAAGIYNQFVAKNMTLDAAGNYTLAWSVCDNKNSSVIHSGIYTLGMSFSKLNYTMNAEVYLRQTAGINRFVEVPEGTIVPYEGTARTRGLDVFIKKEFRKQTVWMGYTLSKTEEHYPYFPDDSYVPAMHDQRHELKMAGLFKLGSFHCSANYVYGSGFPDPGQSPTVIQYSIPYNRLDVAVIYSFKAGKISVDGGISVLNVFNTENIRYSNYTRIPTDETNYLSLYAEAVPFTPSLFLKMQL